MKVLRLYTWFRLPDEFSGSLEDALELMADRTMGVPEPTQVSHEDALEKNKRLAALDDISWPAFMDTVGRGGRQYIAFDVHKLTDGQWTRDACKAEVFQPVIVAPSAPADPPSSP